MKQITATEFKANCLAVVEQVRKTRKPVRITRYGKPVAEGVRKSTDVVKAQMVKGGYVIFKGPLKDNTGKIVIDNGVAHQQTDVVLEQMNYLVEGVIGKV